VAYLIREDGSPVLLTSRARVALLVRVTLARLELLACLIGDRLQKYLRQVLLPAREGAACSMSVCCGGVLQGVFGHSCCSVLFSMFESFLKVITFCGWVVIRFLECWILDGVFVKPFFEAVFVDNCVCFLLVD
jgi:hypothetical protein